jgi:hypothetical protein
MAPDLPARFDLLEDEFRQLDIPGYKVHLLMIDDTPHVVFWNVYL